MSDSEGGLQRIIREAYEREQKRQSECEHRWLYIGEAKDGTTFYRCPKCGKEVEG